MPKHDDWIGYIILWARRNERKYYGIDWYIVGMNALDEAVGDYDGRGFFSKWLNFKLRQAWFSAMRKWRFRYERHAHLPYEYENLYYENTRPYEFDQLEKLRELLADMRHSRPKDYDYIHKFFFHDMNMADIAREYGISKQRVSKVIARTLESFKNYMAA